MMGLPATRADSKSEKLAWYRVSVSRSRLKWAASKVWVHSAAHTSIICATSRWWPADSVLATRGEYPWSMSRSDVTGRELWRLDTSCPGAVQAPFDQDHCSGCGISLFCCSEQCGTAIYPRVVCGGKVISQRNALSLYLSRRSGMD